MALPLPPSLLQVCHSFCTELVPLTTCLLQLPFSPPFSLPFKLSCPSCSPCCLQRAVCYCDPFYLAFFLFAFTAFLMIMYMQSLLQPLQLPNSIATRAHASLLPSQHPRTSSNTYSLFRTTTCIPSVGQLISTDNHAFCSRVDHPNSAAQAPCQLIPQSFLEVGQNHQHELQHLSWV